MLPDDRLICTFVEPLSPGDTFTDWPLHVTIIPWFRLNDNSGQITEGLRRAMSPIKSFSVKATGKTLFGPKHNRPAMLLEAGEFPEIEQRCRNYLHKKRAWLVDETTKKKRSFRPHVSDQREKKFCLGERLLCDRLFIVEQMGDCKEVVGEIKL